MSADHRATTAIGRHARLELAFGYRRGRTVLTHAYAEPPFRIGRCFEAGDEASMIVVCAAPGVFPGDDLEQSIHVASGARVTLRSQSALQAHPGAGPAARLDARYEVDAGAALRCVWDPLIPFPHARLAQRTDIRIAVGSRFYWSDAMMTGRCARGESWTLGTYDHELRLSVDGTLTYLERYRLAPAEHHLRAPWVAGGASYLGSILASSSAPAAEAAETLQRRLDGLDGVWAGFDPIAAHLMLGRLLAWRGPAFAAARKTAEDAVER